jgi:hypothetical protein
MKERNDVKNNVYTDDTENNIHLAVLLLLYV